MGKKQTCNARGSFLSDETLLYKRLGALTKDENRWAESAAFVVSLLAYKSVKIQAKALWLLGEIGLKHPLSVRDAVDRIAAFCLSPEPLLRERALNALGRIGRGNFGAIEPYWEGMFRLAADGEARVRLAFIWASENIAVNTPDVYGAHMPLYAKLLYDADDRVRTEAPEIFRVLGKRRPEFIRPFEAELLQISKTDANPVVRIHCLGALRATAAKREISFSGDAGGR